MTTEDVCAAGCPLGVDLMGSTDSPEDLVVCNSTDVGRDVMLVVSRAGEILAAFILDASPSRLRRARLSGDHLMLDFLIADTTGEGPDVPHRVSMPYDRAARRLGAGDTIHLLPRAGAGTM